jgi:hypothetical protein
MATKRITEAVITRLDRAIQYSRASQLNINAPEHWIGMRGDDGLQWSGAVPSGSDGSTIARHRITLSRPYSSSMMTMMTP